jgi:hypothetical protein
LKDFDYFPYLCKKKGAMHIYLKDFGGNLGKGHVCFVGTFRHMAVWHLWWRQGSGPKILGHTFAKNFYYKLVEI